MRLPTQAVHGCADGTARGNKRARVRVSDGRPESELPGQAAGAPSGVTFIEYALLGAIAVFIGWLFRGALATAFDGILSGITDALGNGGLQK